MKNYGVKKFKTLFKKNRNLFFLIFSLTLLNIFFLCWSFSSNGLTFGKTFLAILIGSILLEIVLCFILYFAHTHHWKIEKTFLVLGIIIGSIYVLALPVGRAPDEGSHFYRIYELTEGHVTSEVINNSPGSMEPDNIDLVDNYIKNNVTYREVASDLGIYANSDQEFIATSAYSYNYFSYLPHVIGMLIGKIMHLPILVTAYLSKFFNLIACITILYFSIKYIPFLKNIVFFIAFLPITMQAMASLSPDGLATASAIALISFVLYSIYSLRTTFTKKHYILLFLICLILSMGKIAYAPLCLLLFAIPKERFSTTSKKYLIIISMGIAIFALLLLWLLIAPSIQSAHDSATQTSSLISNPIKYLAIVLYSVSTNAHLYITGFLGGNLEWFNVTLSPLYLIPAFIVLVLLCVKARQHSTITREFKVLSIITSLIVILITFTTMYIQWTEVGENVIDGVQGRYFLPLALLIPVICLPTKAMTTKSNHSTSITSPNYYLYSFLIFESVYAITTIICTHI